MLVFQLYFDKDLSAEQISRCRGVNLSKAGVEKVINRLKERIRSVVSPGASEAIMR
jgi:Zn-finger nucleic acid-binding protein